jgi:predicted Zn finger-like uncharacterized protein
MIDTDSPMLITCPSCASEYMLDPEKIGAEGRRVRCIQCKTVWTAQKPPVEIDQWDQLPAAEDSLPQERVLEDTFGFTPATNAASVSDAAWEEAAQGEHDVAAALFNTVHQAEPDLQQIAADAPEPAPAIPRTAPDKSRKRPAGEHKAAKPPSAWMQRALGALASPAAITFLGLSIITLGILKRETVVTAAPSLAGLFEMVGLPTNIRGVHFENITSETLTSGTDRFLVIEGVIAGARKERVQIPQIELVVRDAQAKPLYTWAVEPPRSSLIPGDTMRFRARLASPPENGHDVMVRFAGNSAASATAKPTDKSANQKPVAQKTAQDKTAAEKM